jgi:hypothetical protein
VALLGIAPTCDAQRAFHDSQQWAVRADIACAIGPCGGRSGDLLAAARDVARRVPHG